MNNGSSGSSGFALLVLLMLMATASVAAISLAQRALPPLALQRTDADDHLTTARLGLGHAYRRQGAFPTSLDSLAGTAGLPVAGRWRIDPYGHAADLDYTRPAGNGQLRSRGPDRQLGTADDVVLTAAAEVPLRARQRGRLRLLRALLFRSQYRTNGTMNAAQTAAMAQAMNQLAAARRAWLTTPAADRPALALAIASATTTIGDLCRVHGCTQLPVALTGASGLLTAIGSSDAMAIDGRGRQLLLDPGLGILAAGNDMQRGTDDDM